MCKYQLYKKKIETKTSQYAITRTIKQGCPMNRESPYQVKSLDYIGSLLFISFCYGNMWERGHSLKTSYEYNNFK